MKTIADKLPSAPKQREDVLVLGDEESLSLGIMNETVVKYLESRLPDSVIDVNVSSDNPDFEVFKNCVHEYINTNFSRTGDEKIKKFDSFDKWHIILDKNQTANYGNPLASKAVILFYSK